MKWQMRRTGRISASHTGGRDGTLGLYYTIEENACSAVTDFLLRTGNPRESVVSVEGALGRRWIRAL